MTGALARSRSRWVAAATTAAWLGFYVHNLADLPGQTLLSPESGLPTIVYVLLFLAWLLFPTRRVALWGLFSWALLNLVGGGLSVLPLPFLPFYPEQSVRHYLFHLLYGLAQLPLIAIMWSWLRQRS